MQKFRRENILHCFCSFYRPIQVEFHSPNNFYLKYQRERKMDVFEENQNFNSNQTDPKGTSEQLNSENLENNDVRSGEEERFGKLFIDSENNAPVLVAEEEQKNIVLYVEEGSSTTDVRNLIQAALSNSCQKSDVNNHVGSTLQQSADGSMTVIIPAEQSDELTEEALTIDEAEISSTNQLSTHVEMNNLFQLARLSGSLPNDSGKLEEFNNIVLKVEENEEEGNDEAIADDVEINESAVEIMDFEEDKLKHKTDQIPGQFNVGDLFYSLKELEESLRIYEEENGVKLYKRDVRSLEALLKRSLKLKKLKKINQSLQYGQLLYCCVYGGKRRAQKIACIDASGVARYTDCHMFIRFAISNDGTALMVNEKNELHCHDEVVTNEVDSEQPQYRTNTGNAKEICLGAGFIDLDELYKAIHKYETANHVHLWRRDGRTIEALAKRSPGTAKRIMDTNPGLRFAELRFCCSHGGRQMSHEKKDKTKSRYF